MSAIKSKNKKEEDNDNNLKGESSDEFLNRMFKLKEDSAKKAAEELAVYSNSKEALEFKEQGETFAKNLKEREECKKIIEEFAKNPPILTRKSIAGISVERFYSPEDQKKIEAEVIRSGGKYFVAKDFESFHKWFNQLENGQ